MSKIEAVVFDMDGLMFETEKLWIDSVIKTNEVYGYNLPIDLAIECIGKRKDDIDKRFKELMGNDFDTDEFRRLNRIFMRSDVEENGLGIKKGLHKLISYLKENNIKIAVASSSSFERINERFNQANMDINIFDSVIGGNMVTKSKPDPQIYLKSCEVLGVKPSNAIALEDSDYGILSSYNAGMIPILIPDIKKPKEETINIAYKVLNNLEEVIDVIKE